MYFAKTKNKFSGCFFDDIGHFNIWAGRSFCDMKISLITRKFIDFARKRSDDAAELEL